MPLFGPPPKNPDVRQRRNKPSALRVLSPADAVEVPRPPSGLGRKQVQRWNAVWRSPIARLIDRDADLPAIERWIQQVDERERLWRKVRKDPEVWVNDNIRANPLYSVITDLDKAITRAEEMFGMNPSARLRLGIALGEATRSLADIAMDVADVDEVDPRIVDIGT